MTDLRRAFLGHLLRLDVLNSGDRVLVAFSGGKDSTALLSLMWDLKDDISVGIRACHVNHGIRGEEADRDEAFCRSFCEERGIPFHARHANVPAYCQKTGLGQEEGARKERYRLLRETAKEWDCRFIATAHSADDQAETVLFRLARGSGYAGAAGITALSGDLLRPLLPFSSKEILGYLQEKNLPFVTDSSNADLSYARNRIRGEVLPALKQAVPGSAQALVRFAETAAWQNDLVRKRADAWQKETQIDPSCGAIPFSALALLAEDTADRPVLYEIFRRMIGKEDIAVSQERFLALLSLLNGKGQGKIIEIANGFSFFRRQKKLCFGPTPKTSFQPSFQRVLKEGENAVPEMDCTLTLSPSKPGKARNIHKNHLIIHAASDRITGELFVRELRPGDRVRMNGMSKSVKKALSDLGLSSELRKRIPVVCDESGIFWVPGLGLCDRARDPEASFVFTMRLTRKE